MTTPAKTKTYYVHEIGYSDDPSPHYHSIIREVEIVIGDDVPRYHFTSQSEAKRHGADELGRSNRAIGARI
jgi:hypothetical protein